MGPVTTSDETPGSAREDPYQGDLRKMESTSAGEYPEQWFGLF